MMDFNSEPAHHYFGVVFFCVLAFRSITQQVFSVYSLPFELYFKKISQSVICYLNIKQFNKTDLRGYTYWSHHV